MVGMANTILTIVSLLAATASLIYLHYLLSREKGMVNGVLGFFFPAYPYVWGWVNASRLQILDIMIFWSFVSIGSIAFPIFMGAVSLPFIGTLATGAGQVTIGSDANHRGPITAGNQVKGRIDNLFGVDEWTLTASAGQTISLRCDPAPGSEIDPRLTVIAPNGQEVASNDDGDGGASAIIPGQTLADSGVYRIQLDVWSAGAYVLTDD